MEAKADSTYKIVGAASIVAKVTRDRWVEGWLHPEGDGLKRTLIPVQVGGAVAKTSKGKAGPRKSKKQQDTSGSGSRGQETEREGSPTSNEPRNKRQKLNDEAQDEDARSDEPVFEMREAMGSGYPSGESLCRTPSGRSTGLRFAKIMSADPCDVLMTDPKTQQYLRSTFDPVFGYPQIVRFSWAGPKLSMEKEGVACKWIDEVDPKQKKLSFTTLTHPTEDKGKAKLCKELGLSNVGEW